jgi:uncharacterized protein (TIGR02444 family)
MSYWDWAVAVHGRPGVDAALNGLQDEHGQCVAYLLWAAWAAAEGRPLDAGTLAAGAAIAAQWEAAATTPLRHARRALKPALPPIADAPREALREQVRKAEFAAERLLMETLEAMAPEPGATGADISKALAAASAAWNRSAPAGALNDLASRLS